MAEAPVGFMVSDFDAAYDLFLRQGGKQETIKGLCAGLELIMNRLDSGLTISSTGTLIDDIKLPESLKQDRELYGSLVVDGGAYKLGARKVVVLAPGITSAMTYERIQVPKILILNSISKKKLPDPSEAELLGIVEPEATSVFVDGATRYLRKHMQGPDLFYPQGNVPLASMFKYFMVDLIDQYGMGNIANYRK